MKTIPSDFSLLKEIYLRYYDEFKSFSHDQPDRSSKIYMPIDIESISEHFHTDPDIVFGRLYYHLNRKYGFENKDGSETPFFCKTIGEDRHAINFPMLASVIAGCREERNKLNISIYLSIIAITISLLTLALNGFKIWRDTTHILPAQKQETLNNQPESKQNTPKRSPVQLQPNIKSHS